MVLHPIAGTCLTRSIGAERQRSGCSRSHAAIAASSSGHQGRPGSAPRRGGGADNKASAITWRKASMAFGTTSAVGAFRRGARLRSGPAIRLLSAAGPLRSSITTPRSSSSGVERCTSERASSQRVCPGSIATPWAAAGPAAGPWPDRRATKLRWGGLGNQQESRLVAT